MMWLTWRQFRAPAALAAAALGVMALLLGITNTHPATVSNGFLSHYHLLQFLSTGLVAVPALLGAFWGAPLVARELESGTYRLAWTQSISRTRWLACKIGVVGVASVAATGLLTLMLTGWSSSSVNLKRFSSAMFGERGIAPMGYVAFAVLLGITAGILIHRTLPAMATTLVTFVAVRIAVTYWVRPHFATPFRLTQSLAAEQGGAGFHVKAGDWLVSDNTVNAAGHVVNNITCNEATQRCAAQYREILAYQPSSRYWTFQIYETAIFVGLALILAGFCFWWLRPPRRLIRAPSTLTSRCRTPVSGRALP